MHYLIYNLLTVSNVFFLTSRRSLFSIIKWTIDTKGATCSWVISFNLLLFKFKTLRWIRPLNDLLWRSDILLWLKSRSIKFFWSSNTSFGNLDILLYEKSSLVNQCSPLNVMTVSSVMLLELPKMALKSRFLLVGFSGSALNRESSQYAICPVQIHLSHNTS